MTTTVKIEAHCNEKTEVKIELQDNDSMELFTLQDGEAKELHVYDDKVVTIQESPKIPDEAVTDRTSGERMMKWFEYGHLPEKLQFVSASFHDLAKLVVLAIEPGPERTAALRKLLEAKDAAVRARLHPGG